MAEMHVTHDSPTRITLELDPDWQAETSNTYLDNLKQGRGCLAIVVVAFLLLCGIIGYSRSTDSLSTLPWSFWVVAVLVLIGGGLFLLLEVFFVVSHINDSKETTVTIDPDSGRVSGLRN